MTDKTTVFSEAGAEAHADERVQSSERFVCYICARTRHVTGRRGEPALCSRCANEVNTKPGEPL